MRIVMACAACRANEVYTSRSLGVCERKETSATSVGSVEAGMDAGAIVTCLSTGSGWMNEEGLERTSS